MRAYPTHIFLATWLTACSCVLATIPGLAEYRSRLSKAALDVGAYDSERRKLNDCDNAYAACQADGSCIMCALALYTITDDAALDGTCEDILTGSIPACNTLSTSSGELLCEVADACLSDDDPSIVDDDDDDPSSSDDDDDEEPCPTDACEVPHPNWLGDGWCDYDYGVTRCYNSEACGYDGGDCCEKSCVSSDYLTCGLHGYQCLDPDNQPCNGEKGTVYMHDSWGDGWNDASYLIAETTTSTTVASGTLDTGSEGSDDICLSAGCYTMVISCDSSLCWMNEISWDLEISDIVIATGGAPSSCYFSVGGDFCSDVSNDISACSSVPEVDDDDCSVNGEGYTLVLHDANGQGWGDASFTLSTHASATTAGTEIETGTLEAGYQTSIEICLLPGCYTMKVDGGDLHDSWQIASSNGIVAEGIAPAECDFSIGGFFCASTCTLPSCTEGQSAFILAMHDKAGDGWNGNTYTISEADSGSPVATGTLESGDYAEDAVCLDDGVCYSVSIGGGTGSNEVFWQLGSPSAGVLASGEFAEDEPCDFSTPGDSDTAYACVRTCFDIYDNDDDDSCSGGQMGGPSTLELVLYDSAGDGWDGASYSVTRRNEVEPLYDGTLEMGQEKQINMCLPVGCYVIEVESGDKDAEVSWFLGDAGLSGGAPSTCTFHVGYPDPSCPKECLDDQDDLAVPEVERCTTTQTVAGNLAEVAFEECTSPQIYDDLYKDMDLREYDWKELDDFEDCAFDSTTEGWPDSCRTLLSNAEQSDDTLVKKLARNLNMVGGDPAWFCDVCVYEKVQQISNAFTCKKFAKNFLELIRESGEACNALDAMDCAYLDTFVSSCMQNVVDEFGEFDLTDQQQCDYIGSLDPTKSSGSKQCGGLDAPYFRHITSDPPYTDCLNFDKITVEETVFFAQYANNCAVYEDDDEETSNDESTDDSKDNDNWYSNDDWYNAGDDDSESADSGDDAVSVDTHTHSSASAGVAVGVTLAILMLLGCGGGGLYYLKKRRDNSEGYQLSNLGAVTFSPMVTNARTQKTPTENPVTPRDFATLQAELESQQPVETTTNSDGARKGGYIPVEIE